LKFYFFRKIKIRKRKKKIVAKRSPQLELYTPTGLHFHSS
jgi:hypothetical protein